MARRSFVSFSLLMDLEFSEYNHSLTTSCRNFFIFIFVIAFWYTICAFTLEVLINKCIANLRYYLMIFFIIMAYDTIWHISDIFLCISFRTRSMHHLCSWFNKSEKNVMYSLLYHLFDRVSLYGYLEIRIYFYSSGL